MSSQAVILTRCFSPKGSFKLTAYQFISSAVQEFKFLNSRIVQEFKKKKCISGQSITFSLFSSLLWYSSISTLLLLVCNADAAFFSCGP